MVYVLSKWVNGHRLHFGVMFEFVVKLAQFKFVFSQRLACLFGLIGRDKRCICSASFPCAVANHRLTHGKALSAIHSLAHLLG